MATQTQSQKNISTNKKQASGVTAGSMQKSKTGQQPSSEEIHQMIAEEAYRIAERRGFSGDQAMDDWFQAEAAINARFEEKH